MQLYPTYQGLCSDSPINATGSIDFEPFDGGLAGTFSVSELGMWGTFSMGQDPGLCDLPPQVDAGPYPDLAATTCDPLNACLDAGLSGTSIFQIAGPYYPGDWCFGPVPEMHRQRHPRMSGVDGGPVIKLPSTRDSEWTIEADLSCCPAGPGSLPATVTLSTTFCDSFPLSPTIVVDDAPATVTFTQTDGGLMGWIFLDAGFDRNTTATFDLSATE